MRQRLVLLAGVAATGVAVEPAVAQEKTPVPWLTWTVPPECPGPDFVASRVQSWLGGSLPSGLAATGELTWTGHDWEVHVVIVMDGITGERRVRVATCGDAAEFLAVAVVLAVDPEKAAAWPSAPSTTEAIPKAADASAEPAEAPTERPPEPPVATDPVPEPAKQDAPSLRSSWFLGTGVEGATGALPSFQLGPVLEGGLERGRVQLLLGARLLPPVSQTPDGAVASIEYGLGAGRIGIRYLGRLGPVELGPSAQVDVGALWTKQTAPGDVTSVVPWVDLQVGVVGRFFGPRLALVLGAWLSVPLTQPTFVVDSGDVVHQPTVGAVFDAGVQFFFGPR